jgi:hypothetical protein
VASLPAALAQVVEADGVSAEAEYRLALACRYLVADLVDQGRRVAVLDYLPQPRHGGPDLAAVLGNLDVADGALDLLGRGTRHGFAEQFRQAIFSLSVAVHGVRRGAGRESRST